MVLSQSLKYKVIVKRLIVVPRNRSGNMVMLTELSDADWSSAPAQP